MIFLDMTDVINANARSGNHWFEPATKRFFRSRIGTTLYGGRYFISSEQFSYDSSRRYTVRVVAPDGSISTLGEFQQYTTAAQARAAIRFQLATEAA